MNQELSIYLICFLKFNMAVLPLHTPNMNPSIISITHSARSRNGDRILSRIKFIQVIVEELSGDRVRRRDQQVNRNRNRLVHLERGKQRNCMVCTRPNIQSRASTICFNR
jgi:hypothetical protein